LGQRDKVLIGSFVALAALASALGLLSGLGTVEASAEAVERVEGEVHEVKPRTLFVPDTSTGLEALGPQSPAAGYTSAGEFLAAYWGDDWPEIREQNHVSDKWLERINLRDLQAWELAGPEVGDSVIETIDVLDETFVKDSLVCNDLRGKVDLERSELRLELPGGVSQDFEPIRDIARRHRAMIAEAGRSYRTSLERAVREYWSADRAVHHPIVMPITQRPRDAVFHLRSARQWWVFDITLTAKEYPGLAKKKALVESLQAACVEEIATELVRLREAAPATEDEEN